MIFVNGLPIIKHCASVHACCKTWAVEAHEVASSKIGVATNAKLRIDGITSEGKGMDGVLRHDGSAIVFWWQQLLYY